LLSTPVGRFRAIAFVEGVSTLLLFFVAMPIKYVEAFGANPLPVRYIGAAHGGLVILFAIAGVLAMRARKWGFLSGVYGFLAALVPFGTFVYDARFLKPEHARELAERNAASGLQKAG
jgi:integral membrane protein